MSLTMCKAHNWHI